MNKFSHKFDITDGNCETDSDEEGESESYRGEEGGKRNYAKIACLHIGLYIFVSVFLLMGGAVFLWIEGTNEDREIMAANQRMEQLRQQSISLNRLRQVQTKREVETQLVGFLQELHQRGLTPDHYLRAANATAAPSRRWTLASSVFFAFTILSTIGYGNIVPTSRLGQGFTMFFAVIGIPLFLITVADLGRFVKVGLLHIIQKLAKVDLTKTRNQQHLIREILEVVLVVVIFSGFIMAGSAVLHMWETELTYFDCVYFSHISLTTIGLGDIVPNRMDFIVPTLIFITIGLWLTTEVFEQLADVFRLVHYAGRQVGDVRKISVWFGNRRMSVGSLIKTVCRKAGISEHVADQIDWDKVVSDRLNGIYPELVPIFPWHFAEFANKDPPLIDVPIARDFEDYTDRFSTANGSTLPDTVNTVNTVDTGTNAVKLGLFHKRSVAALPVALLQSSQ